MRKNLPENGVDVVFGGQAGSEGKGAIVGHIALRDNYEIAACTFMTNAGHTWISGAPSCEKVMVQQLPVGLVNPDIPHLAIGASSAITIEQLEKELNEFGSAYNVEQRLRIHPRSMIIEPHDAEYEKANTLYLASTAKGCGRALARKVMRSQDVRMARDIKWLRPYLCDTTKLINSALANGKNVLAEGSQGFDLDMHHGIDYPHCTSRQTTPMQVLADLGIPSNWVRKVTATIRTYPIRVGNVVVDGIEIGNSGPFGGREMSWEEITALSGSPEPLLERTTVTKRVRRIFEIDRARLWEMFDITAPDELAVTFIDYIDYKFRGMGTHEFLTLLNEDPNCAAIRKLNEFFILLFDGYEGSFRPNVRYLKTGPRDDETIDLYDLLDDCLYCGRARLSGTICPCNT